MHCLDGGPGAGKTFLINSLLTAWNTTKTRALPCATTGAAAVRLGRRCVTVHSLFQLPYRSSITQPMAFNSPAFQALATADIVVLDEVSMLNCQSFDLVLSRLTEIWGPGWMQEKLLLLVGDLAQLPPVCTHKNLDKPYCERCHITASKTWGLCGRHHLEGSVRHNGDALFLEYLNAIRYTTVSQEYSDSVLGQTYADKDECFSKACPEDSVICTHLEDVDVFNHTLGHRFFPNEQWVRLEMDTDITEECCAYLRSWRDAKLTKFHRLREVCCGAKVVLLKNVDTKHGYANGICGTVVGFVYEAGKVVGVKVQLPGRSRPRTFRRTLKEHLHHQGTSYFRATYPLALGYALSAHKSQGATFTSRVYLYIRSSFCAGLVYVMLSRVTTIANIVLCSGQLNVDDIKPMPRL